MDLQVIISTMHQTNHFLVEKMNIQSDAIVVNQCDTDNLESFYFNNHRITWINSTTRGVGKSRNIGIIHSSADVLLFADDDVVYINGYTEIVMRFFKDNPKCSMAVYNLQSLNPSRPEYIIQKKERLFWFNCLRYGAFRIAVLREELLRNNIWYSLLFGGGAKYQAGEDNLFITDCIKHGMCCMACPEMIGTVKQEESTWFKGYDEKYYRDRGALFSAMCGKKASLFLLLFEMKERVQGKKTSLPLQKIHSLEKQGMKDYQYGRRIDPKKEATTNTGFNCR